MPPFPCLAFLACLTIGACQVVHKLTIALVHALTLAQSDTSTCPLEYNMSNAIATRTAPRAPHTAAKIAAAYAANDLAKIAAAAAVARVATSGKGGKGGKVATPKTDYHGAGHNGVDTFTFRSLTIVRARLDKRQCEVTVTVAGEVVFTDTRGSKAVTAAQTLISTLVTLKNERSRLITAKNGKISALTTADINERLVNLDARCKVALTTAKFAGIDPAWLAVVTPAKMSA